MISAYAVSINVSMPIGAGLLSLNLTSIRRFWMLRNSWARRLKSFLIASTRERASKWLSMTVQ